MQVKHVEQRIEDEHDEEKNSFVTTTSYCFKVGEEIAVVATVKLKDPTSHTRKLVSRIEKILARAVGKAENLTQSEIDGLQDDLDLDLDVDNETGEIREVVGGN